MRKTFVLSSALILAGCVTSSEMARRKDDYVDPTNVQTVDEPSADGASPAVAGGPGAAPQVPAVNADSLQREIDVLKGQLEDSRVRVLSLENENRKLMDEVVKLKSAPTPPPSPPPEAQAKKSGAPLLWELARKDLGEGHFKEAVAPLEELARTYPKDPRALYSLLALGLAQYRLAKYEDAVVIFNQMIDAFPKAPETAMAWFGGGAALFKAGKKDDSKLFYGEVMKRFPKSGAAKEAKKYLARKKGGAPQDLFDAFHAWDAEAPTD